MFSLVDRLKLEIGSRTPAEVRELNLDNSKDAKLQGVLDEYVELEALTLVNCGLSSLDGLPSLPKLKNLELSENQLSSGFEILLDKCPNLERLNLSNNSITTLDVLKPLAGLKSLISLDAYGCEAFNLENYRSDLFEAFENLKYLDGYDRQNVEEPDDDEDDEIDDGDSVSDGDEEDEDMLINPNENVEDYGDSDEEVDDEEDDDEEDDEDEEESVAVPVEANGNGESAEQEPTSSTEPAQALKRKLAADDGASNDEAGENGISEAKKAAINGDGDA